jgi:DNA-binding NarL/FixJ family response regulator
MPSPFRILLADDHAVFREGLRRLIEEDAALSVVGEAANGEEALALAAELLPDVLVLDVQMPGMPGPEVARLIRDRGLSARVLGLSAHDDPAYVERFLNGGALGYVTKDRPPSLIVEAVRQVAQGMPIWLVRHPLTSPLHEMTERERDILRLLGSGLANEDIAVRLTVAESTVRNALTLIYDKIGVTTAREAVAWAWRHNLVDE